jgi:N-acetylglucosamine-6-phosphate deacetylase
MTQPKQLVVRGGQVLTPLEERLTDILVEDGLIARIGDLGGLSDGRVGGGSGGEAARAGARGAHVIDAAGCLVTPGLFDLQVNGGPDCDFWGELNAESVARFTKTLAAAGVTAFLPTIITTDLAGIRKNVRFLKKEVPMNGSKGSSRQQFWSRMPGIHLEGPCLSPQKPGVHPLEHLQPLTPEVISQLVDDSVRLITLAPELDPSGACLKLLHAKGIRVALGHSDATYEEAQQAFGFGVRMMTHTFNALPGLHHRKPGAVAAALLNDDVYCCMICDGKHLAPAAAQLILKTKGVARTILVTDIAQVGTIQGGLVGSSILLDEAVRNVVQWGIASFRDAIVMSTYNPAKAMGLEDSLGQLEVGRHADFVLWNAQTLAIEKVFVGGELVA